MPKFLKTLERQESHLPAKAASQILDGVSDLGWMVVEAWNLAQKRGLLAGESQILPSIPFTLQTLGQAQELCSYCVRDLWSSVDANFKRDELEFSWLLSQLNY